jgi:post-segregation antitoxin (ccd killing protein)
VEAIDSRPQQVRDTLRVWSRRIRQRLDRETAARAVTSELEPQMLVHATLSREWEHAGESRWQQGREPLPLFVASREAADDAARAPGAGTLDPEP